MTSIIRILARFAPRLFRRRGFQGVETVQRVSEVPDNTGAKIYIVERNGNRLWAVFDCPCRTGHRLSVNLRASEHPHWTIQREGSVVTVQPSLWYHDDCRSHFFIVRNRVKWV